MTTKNPDRERNAIVIETILKYLCANIHDSNNTLENIYCQLFTNGDSSWRSQIILGGNRMAINLKQNKEDSFIYNQEPSFFVRELADMKPLPTHADSLNWLFETLKKIIDMLTEN